MPVEHIVPPAGEEWTQALPYVYFVSYAIVGTRPGFGNSEIFQDCPVASMEHVEGMRQIIERGLSAGNNACVLNFQLLRGPNED